MKALCGMYVADIKAIPPDKLLVSPGGVARPANELTADTVGMLKWCTATLKGETPADNYMDPAAAAALNTSDAMIDAMTESVDAFAAAFAQADDATLGKVVTAPWGMDTPIYMLVMIATSHIWYHDGQLNYIQALNGDGEVHWMA